jgi:rubrerythrin
MSDNESTTLMPDEILDIALQKEKQAYNFYKRLATQTKVDMVRELIEKLCDEEYKHRKMIEEMIAQMSLGHDVA